MKVFRIALHSLVLSLMNIAAILAAFSLYKFVKAPEQIAFQGPSAAILAIGAFVVWSRLVTRYLPTGFTLADSAEHAIAYMVTFLWAPAILVPLHYLTQGYLTSFTNIEVLWIFQVPVNLLALFAGFIAEGKKLHISMTH